MIKKILTATMAVFIFAAMITIGASAAEYLNQDFENGFDVFMSNTPPEGAERVAVTEGENTVAFFDNATENALQNRINSSVESLPRGGVMMFDFKTGENYGGYIYVEFHRGAINGVTPKCVYQLTVNSHDDNTWYTYIMTMNEDCTEGQVYRKKRDTDEPFVYMGNTANPTNGEATAMWRMYSVKHDCYFDNIRIFNGVFAKNSVFGMNGEEISAFADITSGILTVNMNIICGEVTKETENGGTTYFAKGSKATPMMVLFDKNMRMINCTRVTKELNVGDNAVTIEVDTTGFANRLNGGFAGIYVWDDLMSIRPLADSVELR